MMPGMRAGYALAFALAAVAYAAGAAASETARLVAEAREVLAREDSGLALALFERAVRNASGVEDEVLARAGRVEALSVLGLHASAGEDVLRLESMIEERVIDQALARRVALQIANWNRALSDTRSEDSAAHRKREFRAIESALEFAGGPVERADALEHRSLAYIVAGEFERAFADLREARELYRSEGDEAGIARCLRRNAYTAYRAGDPARALELLNEHRPLIPRRANGTEDPTETRTHEFIRALAALEYGDLDEADRAAHAFVRCSAILLEGLPWGHVMRTHRLSSPAVASLVGALLRHLSHHPEDEARIFDLATILAESAKARLLRVALGHPVDKENLPSTSRREIPRGVAVLRYLDAIDDFTGTRSLALFAERSGTRRVVDLGPSDPLVDDLNRWQESTDSAWNESADSFAQRSESLARRLLACTIPWILEDGDSRIERLVVFADGLLARVPLEALVLSVPHGESDYSKLDYLVRHASVVHLPCYSVFDAIPAPASDPDVIGVFRPILDDDRDDLRFATHERDALRAHRGNVHILEGAGATKRALFECVRRESAGWLHLACHAEADPTFRYTARLLLAPEAPGADESSSALHALEIFALPLRRGVRVVLSACSTVSGDHVEGEGVLGVWRAFLAAGASVVVSTVRDVDDRSAAAWMTSFHREAAKGIPLAEASRRASMAWLDGDDRPRFPRGAKVSDPAHPLLWANYICIGDDGGPLPSRAPR